MQVSQGMLKGNNGKIYRGRQVEVKYKIKITKPGLWKTRGFRITAVCSIWAFTKGLLVLTRRRSM